MCCLTARGVHRAAQRLSGIVEQTPLRYDEERSAWLKLENLQKTGSFKVRGALNALMAQAEQGATSAVVAASAGNHGAGVAWAAKRLGVPAHIIVPVGAPRAKADRIAQLGATVMRYGESFDDSLRYARAFARSNGWRLIHAFDDPEVIAGQGTIACELAEACPDVVVVPIGGGGLASGMGLALRAQGVRLVGAQVQGLDAMHRALRARPMLARPGSSIADGLRVRRVGRRTQQICRQELETIVEVSEQEVRSTMASLAVEQGLIVEGAGAVAVAALKQVSGRSKVAVVTGGNIDSMVMRSVLAGPLASAAHLSDGDNVSRRQVG